VEAGAGRYGRRRQGLESSRHPAARRVRGERGDPRRPVLHGSAVIFGAEDSSEDAATASALAYQPPLGQILVGLVGLGVIGIGLYQLYAAYKVKFREDLRLDVMSDAEKSWVTYAGRVGTAALALAIGQAGAFVVLAAYQSEPSETRSLGAALESLQQQPLGSYMFGAIAVGFLVYGVFMFAIARYRRIDPA
jgi:hypothetical protein